MNTVLTLNPPVTDLLCEQVNALYESVGWGGPYEASALKTALLHTPYALFAFDSSGVAVGMLRAFSDTVFTTELVEVLIRKDRQKQGTGKAMLQKFTEDFAGTSIYACALADSVSFFAPFGIIARPTITAVSRKALR